MKYHAVAEGTLLKEIESVGKVKDRGIEIK